MDILAEEGHPAENGLQFHLQNTLNDPRARAVLAELAVEPEEERHRRLTSKAVAEASLVSWDSGGSDSAPSPSSSPGSVRSLRKKDWPKAPSPSSMPCEEVDSDVGELVKQRVLRQRKMEQAEELYRSLQEELRLKIEEALEKDARLQSAEDAVATLVREKEELVQRASDREEAFQRELGELSQVLHKLSEESMRHERELLMQEREKNAAWESELRQRVQALRLCQHEPTCLPAVLGSTWGFQC